MIFKFLILSDEAEKFKREIKIDADQTFLDFYQAIIDCTGFSEKEMASFFLCDDKWRKKEEITLVEMDTYSDEDSLTMDDCILSDYLEDEKQKLMFVFDYLTERALFIELAEVIPGKNLQKAVCTLSVGEPPKQVMLIEELKTETWLSTWEKHFTETKALKWMSWIRRVSKVSMTSRLNRITAISINFVYVNSNKQLLS